VYEVPTSLLSQWSTYALEWRLTRGADNDCRKEEACLLVPTFVLAWLAAHRVPDFEVATLSSSASIVLGC
jgi:hypothetical protein